VDYSQRVGLAGEEDLCLLFLEHLLAMEQRLRGERLPFYRQTTGAGREIGILLPDNRHQRRTRLTQCDTYCTGVLYPVLACGDRHRASAAPVFLPTSKPRGNDLKGLEDFYLRAKARIWP